MDPNNPAPPEACEKYRIKNLHISLLKPMLQTSRENRSQVCGCAVLQTSNFGAFFAGLDEACRTCVLHPRLQRGNSPGYFAENNLGKNLAYVTEIQKYAQEIPQMQPS